VNAQDEHGFTALMYAAGKGNVYCVKVLIGCHANVNAKDNDGRTALMLAASAGKAESVQDLIAAGADVNAKDKNGNTALMYAAPHLPSIKRPSGNPAFQRWSLTWPPFCGVRGRGVRQPEDRTDHTSFFTECLGHASGRPARRPHKVSPFPAPQLTAMVLRARAREISSSSQATA
jgi:ankyrin repeat protein